MLRRGRAARAQRLLGRVVVALGDLGADPGRRGRGAGPARQDNDTAFLAESDLVDEVERVKVSPNPLTLEEMSKLWGILHTRYLLS